MDCEYFRVFICGYANFIVMPTPNDKSRYSKHTKILLKDITDIPPSAGLHQGNSAAAAIAVADPQVESAADATAANNKKEDDDSDDDSDIIIDSETINKRPGEALS